ncbi:Uma2 family endonuclease [Stratiformator vulcanicus]|uniref:Putative restriction endonuclease domain-containing protein n=1 Tax=Stratiformator vulcanicus TaxID=2527980 RepID=A0A517R500_9PLAN|nr:Uma2 family endonuclease [Stratiformator vulcanicus]QDT38959.1 hypothetical protein Pan189_33590 [Stratiformator vulcanicus]
MATDQLVGMTVEEYLKFERASDLRHEFVNGEIREVTGARRSHNILTSNLIIALGTKSSGRDYEIYPTDMRVRIPGAGYYYPDISISPHPPQLEDEEFDTLLNPIVVFEITSPSTESIDRREKLANYQTIPSLQVYLIVAQDEARIDHYKRLDEDRWQVTISTGLAATVTIDSIGCAISLKEAYHFVLDSE